MSAPCYSGGSSQCGCGKSHDRRERHDRCGKCRRNPCCCPPKCPPKCPPLCPPPCPPQFVPPPLINQNTEPFPGMRVVRSTFNFTIAGPGTFNPTLRDGAGMSIAQLSAVGTLFTYNVSFNPVFAGTPTLSVSIEAAGGFPVGDTVVVLNTSSSSFQLQINQIADVPITVHVIAIGPASPINPNIPAPPFPIFNCCNTCRRNPCGCGSGWGGWNGY